jgi:ribonuclease G
LEQSQIIVNVKSTETRVAILQGGRLAELMIEREKTVVGNVYLGRVENVVPALDAAFVDCGIDRNVFLHVSDAMEEEPSRAAMRRKMDSFPPIKQVVKKGDEFLVQVTKGPVESKGARATRRISLPSRNLVLMADGRGKVGVSKKIDDNEERSRLRELAQKIKPEGFGMIVRTAAVGAIQTDLEGDVKFLMKLWRSIQGKEKQVKAPALVYEDLTLVFEVLRDIFSPNMEKLVVDDKVTYDKVLNIVDNIAPHLRSRVELYRGKEPIFHAYGVESEIDKACRPKVGLPHGGHLNIETTEALTAIDVNSGKFTASSNLQDTVLRTNLEAAEEIARQLRLRDIGGIIVIDFIDMDKAEHRDRVMTALRNAFGTDRMRTRIMHITKLGLVEMTRKRRGESLTQQLLTSCPCCGGRGKVLAPTTIAAAIAAELWQKASDDESPAFAVVADPSVALALIGPEGAAITQVEQRLGREVFVRAVLQDHPENFEIVPGTVKKIKAEHPLLRVGQVVQLKEEDFLHVEGEMLRAAVKGYVIEVPDASAARDQPIKVRIVEAQRSLARATQAEKKR